MSNEPVAWMHVQGNFEEPSLRQLDKDEIGRGWKQYPLYTHPADDTALLRRALEALDAWEGLAHAKLITALRERLEGKV